MSIFQFFRLFIGQSINWGKDLQIELMIKIILWCKRAVDVKHHLYADSVNDSGIMLREKGVDNLEMNLWELLKILW